MSHTMRSWCLEIIFPQCQYLAFPPAHTFNYRSTVTRQFLFSFHNCCIVSHVMSNNETKDKIPIHLSKKLNQNVKKVNSIRSWQRQDYHQLTVRVQKNRSLDSTFPSVFNEVDYEYVKREERTSRCRPVISRAQLLILIVGFRSHAIKCVTICH